MRLSPFRLHRPSTLPEALDLLAQHEDEAQIYMGGTELLMLMKLGLAAPEHLIDCKGLAELATLDVAGEQHWSIGAAVTHRQLERDPDVARRLPSLAKLEGTLANVRVRNVGTLGGNLCFAEPHSDPPTLLIALGASVELASVDGQRRVDLEEFMVGPLMTVREPTEVLTRIRVPATGPGCRVTWQRLAFRERPAANVAYVERHGDHRMVAGAIGGRPVRLLRTESLLAQGGSEDLDLIAQTARDEVEPFDDLDGSVDYKRHLVGVLARRAVRAHMTTGPGR